jgi:hypothetical protein
MRRAALRCCPSSSVFMKTFSTRSTGGRCREPRRTATDQRDARDVVDLVYEPRHLAARLCGEEGDDELLLDANVEAGRLLTLQAGPCSACPGDT